MEWDTMDTLQDKGKMVLMYDQNSKQYRTGNRPKGCQAGIWYYNKYYKKWDGAGFESNFNPTHWMNLPKPPSKNWETKLVLVDKDTTCEDLKKPKKVKEKELTNEEIVNGLNSLNFNRLLNKGAI